MGGQRRQKLETAAHAAANRERAARASACVRALRASLLTTGSAVGFHSRNARVWRRGHVKTMTLQPYVGF